MKSSKVIFCLIIMSLLIVIVSCDDNDSNFLSGNKYTGPIDSVATNITLIVYSNGWGTALDTIEMPYEGSVVIDIEEDNPYSDPPQYFIYATASGFYTEIYKCSKSQSIDVDLEAYPDITSSVMGTIFATQLYFADCPLRNYDMVLSKKGSDKSYDIKTDSSGRFGYGPLPLGDYSLHFEYQGVYTSFDLTNNSTANYYDLYFPEPLVILAPNIYLYPEETTDIKVSINFIQGGKIIESEPEYGNGWNVSVDPDGLIENKYDYLFYEATYSNFNNLESGFIFASDNLESEFRNLLSQYGCNQKEIDDFIEFWIPRLNNADFYAVYPQNVEKMISLDIAPEPENILRILFVFRPLPEPIDILPYTLPDKLDRNGYTAVEWGGVEL